MPHTIGRSGSSHSLGVPIQPSLLVLLTLGLACQASRSAVQGPERPIGPTGTVFTTRSTPKTPLTFIHLSGGSFSMGSPEGTGTDAEYPQHKVTLSPFAMGRSEVTQAQWAAVVSTAQARGIPDAATLLPQPPSMTGFVGPSLPAMDLPWCDVARFANSLSRLEGLRPAYALGPDCEKGGEVLWNRRASGFRLPTEAEWEYAARAGSTSTYATGDRVRDLSRLGWHRGNSRGRPHEVCTAAKKPWGLCDLYGNVEEWVWDWYAFPYSTSEKNPAGPETGSSRVLRGGSWLWPAERARAASRIYHPPGGAWPDYGLRLVMPSRP